jgi:hypothetical protein
VANKRLRDMPSFRAKASADMNRSSGREIAVFILGLYFCHTSQASRLTSAWIDDSLAKKIRRDRDVPEP